jgi:hypothetical protein
VNSAAVLIYVLFIRALTAGRVAARRSWAARSPSGSGALAIDANLFQQSDAVEVRRVTNRGKGGRAVFARRDIAAARRSSACRCC